MIEEAASAGFYESLWYQQKYPRLQILTVEQLLAGKRVDMPPSFSAFKQAEKVKENQSSQSSLGI